MIADGQRMLGRAAQHGVFHDDAVRADDDRPAVGGQHGAEQDAAVGAHGDIATQHRGRRDVGRRIDAGPLALGFLPDLPPSLFLEATKTERNQLIHAMSQELYDAHQWALIGNERLEDNTPCVN